MLVAFITASVPPSYAQMVAGERILPQPGTMVTPSVSFVPAVLKGMKVYPADQLRFDFLIDTGNSALQGVPLQQESTRLIRYFLAALTVPEDELWVNLSPYEGDRIIPDNFGLTEMGRDLLAEDYILKQLTSSMMYPEKALGREVWKKIYARVFEKYGTTDIPLDTFNKVWIVPDEAVVYVNGDTAFIAKSHLKVMLDTDYTSMRKNSDNSKARDGFAEARGIPRQVMREIVLPEIEKEVNNGENFGTLRQIYHAMILSTWFKRNLKRSLVGQVYAAKNKVTGIDLADKKVKDKIWQQYEEAFRKGVFNYIKEEKDETTSEIIPRKYFSGGFHHDPAMVKEERVSGRAMVDAAQKNIGKNVVAEVEFDPVSGSRTSGFKFPSIDAPEVLALMRGAHSYETVDALISLGRGRPGLAPQIVSALLSLYQDPDVQGIIDPAISKNNTSIASEILHLGIVIHGQHRVLITRALASLVSKGVDVADSYLERMYSRGHIPVEIARELFQYARENDENVLYGLGFLLSYHGNSIWDRLESKTRDAVIEVLGRNALRNKTFREVGSLGWIVSHAAKDRLSQEKAIRILDALVDAGSDEAKNYLMNNLNVYARYYNRGELIRDARFGMDEIKYEFERMFPRTTPPDRVKSGTDNFRERLSLLVFELAKRSEKDGFNIWQRLLQYGHWQELNILRPLAWPAQIRSHLFINRVINRFNNRQASAGKLQHKLMTTTPQAPKGRAVVIYPKSDRNAAFMRESAIDQLIKEGYSVLYYEVASVKEMVDAFIDATGDGKEPASFVIIGGHGNPWSIDFGHYGDETLRTEDRRLTSGMLSKFVKADAKGIAESCSTGAHLKRKKINMIQALSNAFGIRFSGPSDESYLDEIKFKTGKHVWGRGAKNKIATPQHSETVVDANNLNGGIDLNSDKLRLLETGGKINFNIGIDAAMLEERIDGFTPVVLGVTTLNDPRSFFEAAR